ncbi:MAG: hypothetical protein ACOZJX_15865 [Pseudomonadota bacterium]
MNTPVRIRLLAFAAAIVTSLVLAEAVALLAMAPQGRQLLAQAVHTPSKT